MLISLDSYADEKQLRSDKNEVNGQNRDITIKFTVKQANKMSLKLNVRFVNSSFSPTTKCCWIRFKISPHSGQWTRAQRSLPSMWTRWVKAFFIINDDIIFTFVLYSRNMSPDSSFVLYIHPFISFFLLQLFDQITNNTASTNHPTQLTNLSNNQKPKGPKYVGPQTSSCQYLYSSPLSHFQARVKFVYQLKTDKPGEKKQFLYLIGWLPYHLTIICSAECS